jgi:hypothetical protein
MLSNARTSRLPKVGRKSLIRDRNLLVAKLVPFSADEATEEELVTQKARLQSLTEPIICRAMYVHNKREVLRDNLFALNKASEQTTRGGGA